MSRAKSKPVAKPKPAKLPAAPAIWGLKFPPPMGGWPIAKVRAAAARAAAVNAAPPLRAKPAHKGKSAKPARVRVRKRATPDPCRGNDMLDVRDLAPAPNGHTPRPVIERTVTRDRERATLTKAIRMRDVTIAELVERLARTEARLTEIEEVTMVVFAARMRRQEDFNPEFQLERLAALELANAEIGPTLARLSDVVAGLIDREQARGLPPIDDPDSHGTSRARVPEPAPTHGNTHGNTERHDPSDPASER